jgi:hypothetical protein
MSIFYLKVNGEMLMRVQTRILSVLFLIFSLPPLAAWWFYQHPSGWMSSKINHGHLVNPPVQMKTLAQPHAWQLIYLSKQNCDAACQNKLEQLAKIRLALGRHMVGLGMVLLAPEPQSPVLKHLHDMDVQWVKLSQHDLQKIASSRMLNQQDSLWLMDASGWLVLTYPQSAKPKAIYADLKRLSPLWEQ